MKKMLEVILVMLALGLAGCNLTDSDTNEMVINNENGQVLVLDQDGKVIEQSAPRVELEELFKE